LREAKTWTWELPTPFRNYFDEPWASMTKFLGWYKRKGPISIFGLPLRTLWSPQLFWKCPFHIMIWRNTEAYQVNIFLAAIVKCIPKFSTNSTWKYITTFEGPTLLPIIHETSSSWAHKPKQLHINTNILQDLFW